MATIFDSLKSISAYPIPRRTLEDVAEERGLSVADDATAEIRSSREFKLAKADLMHWLSTAPNVSQGGISYAFTDSDRSGFRKWASASYQEYGEKQQTIYGYKGDRL